MLETYRDDLLAKNRTAERLATIGQFAAGIGHELRNPLGVVETLGLPRDAPARTAPGVRPRRQPPHGEDHDRGQRSGKTINDLLELARSRPPKRRHVDTRQLVLQAVPAANLPLAVDVEGRGGRRGADRRRCRSADPRAHQPPRERQPGDRGKGPIWVDAQREGAATVLRVRDEGPGVPPALREQVFEALFTTRAKGSGLGLALCRRIAEAHGGTVTLEPSESGAVFLIAIPDAPHEVPRSNTLG